MFSYIKINRIYKIFFISFSPLSFVFTWLVDFLPHEQRVAIKASENAEARIVFEMSVLIFIMKPPFDFL